MQRRHVWFAAVFVSLPALLFACAGGRTQIDLDLADEADGGAHGGGAGKPGAAGAGGGASGAAGKSGAGGSGKKVCLPGQAQQCPCAGSDAKGVQSCNSDGTGLGPCMGCPGSSAQGGGGSSTGPGAGGSGPGQGGSGQSGSGQSGSGQGGSNIKDGGGGGDFFDSLPFPLPDSGPVGECVNCLKGECGDSINSCYNNPNCTQGIQCAIQKCFAGGMMGGGTMGGGPLGGGNINFGCLLGCFNGDIGAAYGAIQTFQCITQTCGGNCGGGLLGDGGFPLGGLGGGPFGGGQGGPGPGGMGAPDALYIDDVRVPDPAEVPGYPWLQDALRRNPQGAPLRNRRGKKDALARGCDRFVAGVKPRRGRRALPGSWEPAQGRHCLPLAGMARRSHSRCAPPDEAPLSDASLREASQKLAPVDQAPLGHRLPRGREDGPMAKPHFHRINPNALTDRQETLVERARKFRRKGDSRKALVALREACLSNEGCAWLWTLYGHLLADDGRDDEARKALRHAIWLRRSAGDGARVRTTQRLLDRVGGSIEAA